MRFNIRLHSDARRRAALASEAERYAEEAMRQFAAKLVFVFLLIAIHVPASADFTMCGGPCPPDHHLAGNACNVAACPGNCPNQSICAPNAGASFTMCGSPCPAGYYLASKSCNVATCPGGCPNQSNCQRVDGSSFTMCGGPCPSGYHPTAKACNVAACPGSCDNQTVCTKN